ncbi:unnamed protein product [Mucor circinelloides]
MNRVHFRTIMGRFNNRMKKENRNVALVLDNAPVHDRDLTYSNVKLVFLPPNTTSHYQPLDAGIIANFKYWYRKLQYKYVAIKHSHTEKEIDDNADGGDSEHAKEKAEPFFWIDQLQAMKWILFAWNKVSEGNTIANCWRHTGLLEQEELLPDGNAIEEIEKLDPLEGFIVHEDGTVEVEDQQFDLEENEHLFEGEEEDGEDTGGVSSKAVACAMKLILDNVAPTTDDEFHVMECLSKMYNSYRSEMIANRTTQTKIE